MKKEFCIKGFKQAYIDRINRSVQNLLYKIPSSKSEWLHTRPEFTPRDNDYSFLEVGAKKPKTEKTWQKPVMHKAEPLSKIIREGGKTISDSELTPTNLTDKWGYKSVQFGNYVKDNEAKVHIKRFVESCFRRCCLYDYSEIPAGRRQCI